MQSVISLYKELFERFDNAKVELSIDSLLRSYKGYMALGGLLLQIPMSSELGQGLTLLVERSIRNSFIDEFSGNQNVKTSIWTNSLQFETFYRDKFSPTLYDLGKVLSAFCEVTLFVTYQFKVWEDENIIEVPPEFLVLLNHCRPLLLNELAILIPRSIKYHQDSQYSGFRSMYAEKFESISFPLVNIVKFMPVDDCDKILNESSGLPSINIPILQGPSLEEIVKIRHDHQDEFTLLQRAINELISGMNHEKVKEDYLRDTIEKVTKGVIRVEEQYRRIMGKYKFKGVNTRIGTVGMSLSLNGPEVWKRYIDAILRSRAVSDSVKWYLVEKNAKSDLENLEYWFSWYLAVKS